MGKKNKKIIYSVSVYSEKKFLELFEKSDIKSSQQVQKYHRMLIEGLSFQKDIQLQVISKLPLITKNSNKKFLKKELEKYNDVDFLYLPLFNIPFFNNVHAFFSSLYYLEQEFKKGNKETENIILGDALNITSSIANILFGKIKGIQTIGIVTDIPTFLMESSNVIKQNFLKRKLKSLINIINEITLRKFDSYVFLTQQMNALVNTKNKPYIVMEGHSDIKMMSYENKLEEKYNKKVCLYAGSLKKIYGIDKLIKAFILADIKDSELHIYGSGDYEEEIKYLCRNNHSIKFFGVKRNEYIVNEQIKSSLLINPRPTGEEYTKYSFPSKNMEYMASGTPTLTTKLPGMPEEYYDYIYPINDESIEGLTVTLKKVLMLSKTELHKKGIKAKDFVMKEKNNIIQAEKIKRLV